MPSLPVLNFLLVHHFVTTNIMRPSSRTNRKERVDLEEKNLPSLPVLTSANAATVIN